MFWASRRWRRSLRRAFAGGGSEVDVLLTAQAGRPMGTDSAVARAEYALGPVWSVGAMGAFGTGADFVGTPQPDVGQHWAVGGQLRAQLDDWTSARILAGSAPQVPVTVTAQALASAPASPATVPNVTITVPLNADCCSRAARAAAGTWLRPSPARPIS